MRPKSLILLGLALACGLVASIGISQVMEARQGQTMPTGETVRILVALDNIERNVDLTAHNIKFEDWPKEKVPEGAITALEEIEGRRPTQKIVKGEPILAARLGTGEGMARATEEIPPGYRVVSVRVRDTDGAGLILPGDRVDVQVFVGKNSRLGVFETTTKTFLRDVSVFAVNSEIRHNQDSEESSIAAKTISLLVTPTQAAKVNLMSEVGKIRLIMRGAKDESESEEEVKVSMRDIFPEAAEDGGHQGSKANSRGATAPALDNPAVTAWLREQQEAGQAVDLNDGVWRIRIITGPDVRVEEFQNGQFRPVGLGGASGNLPSSPDDDDTQSPHELPSESDKTPSEDAPQD